MCEPLGGGGRGGVETPKIANKKSEQGNVRLTPSMAIR